MIAATPRRGVWQAPSVDDRASEKKLDLRVAAPQLVFGPSNDCVMERRIESEEHAFALRRCLHLPASLVKRPHVDGRLGRLVAARTWDPLSRPQVEIEDRRKRQHDVARDRHRVVPLCTADHYEHSGHHHTDYRDHLYDVTSLST